MREIKFRLWNGNANRMQTPRGSISPGVFWEQGQLLGMQEFLIPLQYTGLKDKNGVEIYEGDIVTDSDDRPHLVEYRNYCFCLAGIVNSVWLGATHEYLTVIGNIYENPELLNLDTYKTSTQGLDAMAEMEKELPEVSA